MKKLIRLFLHYCKRILIVIIKLFLLIIPKEKSLILFSAWFGEKYADSSMFMYEYMLDRNYNVIWYTRNKQIYVNLKNNDKPVVYAKSLKGIWKQIRAKILVSSVQLSDFNHLFLCKCIYLDLDHGFPLKQVGYKIPGTTKKTINYEKLLKLWIDYYGTAASLFSRSIISECYNVKVDKIIKCNKPRTDVLFDSSLRINKNDIVEKIKHGRKAIIYMPTHRSCGEEKIDIFEILNLEAVQVLCEKMNCVFIIKKHFYHKREYENLDKYNNIFDITNNPDIDSEVLTYQADIMISDYSASYVDFLLLDRPIIFYAYDLEKYQKNERGMYLKFNDINAGYKPVNKEELIDVLYKVTNDWKDNEHSSGRNALRELQFDKNITIGNTREKISSIIDSLLQGNYRSEW